MCRHGKWEDLQTKIHPLRRSFIACTASLPLTGPAGATAAFGSGAPPAWLKVARRPPTSRSRHSLACGAQAICAHLQMLGRRGNRGEGPDAEGAGEHPQSSPPAPWDGEPEADQSCCRHLCPARLDRRTRLLFAACVIQALGMHPDGDDGKPFISHAPFSRPNLASPAMAGSRCSPCCGCWRFHPVVR